MMHLRILLALGFLFSFYNGFSQKNNNELLWSPMKLTAADFRENFSSKEGSTTIMVHIRIKGGSFFSFNNKSHKRTAITSMVRSESGLDNRKNVQDELKYVQLIFDMGEVCTRLIRKELDEQENPSSKQVRLAGEKYAAAFEERKNRYNEECGERKDPVKQAEWEKKIAEELELLKNFALQ